MYRPYLFLPLFSSSFSSSYAEVSFERSFGSEATGILNCIRQKPGSGYILAGSSDAVTNGVDALLVNTDARGDTLWTKTCESRSACLPETKDSGYIIIGTTPSLSPGKPRIWSLFSYGNHAWWSATTRQTPGRPVLL